jgi:hypothetical protein
MFEINQEVREIFKPENYTEQKNAPQQSTGVKNKL